MVERTREFAKRFDRAYRIHQQAIHAYLYARSEDSALAEDLMQEVFARAWARFDDLAPLDDDQQRNWLFAVAKNSLVSELRRKHVRSKRLSATWFDLRFPDNSAAHWETSDSVRRLERLIGQLPEDQRTALVLQVVGGLTSPQIAAVLERPAGTVRYLISTARSELARKLSHDEDDSHDRR